MLRNLTISCIEYALIIIYFTNLCTCKFKDYREIQEEKAALPGK